MLAMAISLLFGFAAFAAIVVIHASLVIGGRRARMILAALDEIEHAAGVKSAEVRRPRAAMARQPGFAAA